MGIETGIAYADHTFSPWEGCCRVHTGCRFCYAEVNSRRWNGDRYWGPKGSRRVMSLAAWKRVLAWNRKALTIAAGSTALLCRRRILPSICDPFEDFEGRVVNGQGMWCVRDLTLGEVRDWFFALVEQTPGLFWMLLTKRPENVCRMVPKRWLVSPPNNVIVCASVSDQETTVEMLGPLMDWPGYKGLSIEPLVRRVSLWAAYDTLGWLTDIEDERTVEQGRELNWVVIGGESGAGARACELGNVEALLDECGELGVPCYVKQLGARPCRPLDDCRLVWPTGTEHVEDIDRWQWCPVLKHEKGGDPKEWPVALRVREYPGLMLEGVSARSHEGVQRTGRMR